MCVCTLIYLYIYMCVCERLCWARGGAGPAFTAAPLRSEEAEAAVGLVLGTVLVLVSDTWI